MGKSLCVTVVGLYIQEIKSSIIYMSCNMKEYKAKEINAV